MLWLKPRIVNIMQLENCGQLLNCSFKTLFSRHWKAMNELAEQVWFLMFGQAMCPIFINIENVSLSKTCGFTDSKWGIWFSFTLSNQSLWSTRCESSILHLFVPKNLVGERCSWNRYIITDGTILRWLVVTFSFCTISSIHRQSNLLIKNVTSSTASNNKWISGKIVLSRKSIYSTWN